MTLFYKTRVLGPQGYLALLNTYSDHRALAKPIKGTLEKEIAKAVEGSGGVLRIYDTMDLYLARKP